MNKHKMITKGEKLVTIDDLHVIGNSQDTSLILKITQDLSKQIGQQNDVAIEELNELHKVIPNNKINEVRVKLIKYLNSGGYDWNDVVWRIASGLISSMIGPDIVVQRKINLSIQQPNDEASILPIHSDCISGDTPWQINLWIPLTSAYSTNSMFLVSRADTIDFLDSLKTCKNNHNKKEVNYVNALQQKLEEYERIYIRADPGQILLFNPAVLHGNTLNQTNKTRISLNIRLKSIFSPDASWEHSSRRQGTYYSRAHITENTQFSFDIMKRMRNE